MKEYKGITVGIYRNLTVKAFCEMCALEKECHANPDNCANLLLFKRKILDQLHTYREVNKETKICSRCHKEKRLSKFGKRLDNADGHINICKECYNENQRRIRELSKKIKKQEAKARAVEYNRKNTLRMYYDPSYRYKEKKYLRRHEKQLEDWLLKKQKYSALLEKDNAAGKRPAEIRKSIVRASEKILKLQKVIEEEKKLLKTTE